MIQKLCKFIVFLLFSPEYVIIINNAVKCCNRPWQYGCDTPNALPHGRAFCVSVQRRFFIEAYLRIIARKKAKPNSVLQYWVLENVPAVKDYIKEEYSAKDLGLQGDIVLRPHEGAAGIYNAKYFGAPTNRERYLCGEFPQPQQTHTDKTAVTLRQVLTALGEPTSEKNDLICDVNYPDLHMKRKDVTDHGYIYEVFRLACGARILSYPKIIRYQQRTLQFNDKLWHLSAFGDMFSKS